MNKRHFRTVSFCVIFALAALAAVQTWSLWRMYADREEEFVRKVTLAMSRAAYDDLLLGSRRNPVPMSTTIVSGGNIDSIKMDLVDQVTVGRIVGVGKVLTVSAKKADTLKMDIRMVRGDTLHRIYQEVRIPGLSALRFDLNRYDSLLRRNLLDAGIDLPCRVDVVRQGASMRSGSQDADSICTVHFGPPAADDACIIASLPAGMPEPIRPKVFTSRITTEDGLLFRVRIENPNRQLLHDMAGIISTSLSMLVVVAFVLIFLLRTLFRQKTLEQMRMDLTHNITHELKTPIAVANAANDAMLDFDAGANPDKRRRYLTIIREQLAALSGMVQRILTMSVEEQEEFRINPERIDVSELFETVAAKCRLQATKPVGIDVSVTPCDPTIWADRFHLLHVLDNLLDNAVKYSGERVRIRLGAIRGKAGTTLTVADNGMGIDPAAQPHLFEKFYRVPTGDRHEVKGFGLGLYYVRLIVAKHGGTIAVDSSPGRGTTFTITLPNNER